MDHVSEARLKAAHLLNLLRRNMHGCNKLAKARAYSALVCPHLESCSPVWSPYQKDAQDALEKVQWCAAVQSGTRRTIAGTKPTRIVGLI